MFDELDDGPRIAVWTVLGIIALLLFGLLGGLGIRALNAKAGAGQAAAGLSTTAPAVVVIEEEVILVDEPLVGDVAGTLYFDFASATLPADAAPVIEAIKAAADAAPGQRLVISGFHDATGDPAKNAELAKERAKAVRAALQAAGVDASRLVLRKPESTTGSGDDREARRVEVRIAP